MKMVSLFNLKYEEMLAKKENANTGYSYYDHIMTGGEGSDPVNGIYAVPVAIRNVGFDTTVQIRKNANHVFN